MRFESAQIAPLCAQLIVARLWPMVAEGSYDGGQPYAAWFYARSCLRGRPGRSKGEPIGALVALDRGWCEYGHDAEALERGYLDM
jgi:hypothetical protein